MSPFISICIPVYKNAAYLDILLQSITSQSYCDYEVIISDDSPDDEVRDLCKKYTDKFSLIYQKNFPTKGSPANWNESIRLAKGQWIKLMHDDDWFADKYCLGLFAEAAQINHGAGFIFSGYSNFENGKLKDTHIPGPVIEWKLKNTPLHLFSENYIGNPSTTLIKNTVLERYDEKIKWVVDFEHYIRVLNVTSFYMIRKSLVNVGINEEQITQAVFRNKSVEIPENIYMLNKMGSQILGNIIVYDYYWRLFRNLQIRDLTEVEKYAEPNTIPERIKRLLNMQFKIPLQLLRIGVLSKAAMALSYSLSTKNN